MQVRLLKLNGLKLYQLVPCLWVCSQLSQRLHSVSVPAPSAGAALWSCELLFQDGTWGWLESQYWLRLSVGLDLSVQGPLTHSMVPVYQEEAEEALCPLGHVMVSTYVCHCTVNTHPFSTFVLIARLRLLWACRMSWGDSRALRLRVFVCVSHCFLPSQHLLLGQDYLSAHCPKTKS